MLPRDFDSLAAILATGCINPAVADLWNLKTVARSTPDFFAELLPFIWQSAADGAAILQDKRRLAVPAELALSQRDCLAILANAFLCRFVDRPSRDSLSGERLPSINLDELYGGPAYQPVAKAKLRMILEYFRRQQERMKAGEILNRNIRFVRCAAAHAAESDWHDSSAPLIPPVIEPVGRAIDDARGALRVDFANRIIGGAALADGSAQEEILFCICPELIVARLYFPALRDDESLLVHGVEQFSTATDYGFDLGFGGPFRDPAAVDGDGVLDSWILAVDAMDFRTRDRRSQYRPEAIARELRKLWSGFSARVGPTAVATGHWGCGIFGGDRRLKFLIQWAAFSRAGKCMRYFPWDDDRFEPEMRELIDRVTREFPTVNLLCNRLLSGETEVQELVRSRA